jgi:hypothetical protein
MVGALVWLAGSNLFELEAPYLAGILAATISYVSIAQFEARAPARDTA